ncbi:MAG: LPS export ABC transporter periplasmic protein LptC [Pseudomonadota bacterium]
MTKNPSAWAMLIFLLLFAAVTLWLDRVVQPTGPKLDGSNRHDPDYIVDNFSSIKLDPTGQPHLTLAAIKMTHYPDDQTTHLVRPHFMRFAPNAAPMHMYSQRGFVSEDGDNAYLHDQVRVVREARGTQSELTLNTSYLHIMPEQELAMTDKPVVIQDAHTFITAVGLKLDQKKHQFKLLSRVKVRYEPRSH